MSRQRYRPPQDPEVYRRIFEEALYWLLGDEAPEGFLFNSWRPMDAGIAAAVRKGLQRNSPPELAARAWYVKHVRGRIANLRDASAGERVPGLGELVRIWEHSGFRLELFDPRKCVGYNWYVGYRLRDGAEPVFSGTDVPLRYGTPESDASLVDVLQWLATPYDPDQYPWTEAYSPEQRAWVDGARGQELGEIVGACHDMLGRLADGDVLWTCDGYFDPGHLVLECLECHAGLAAAGDREGGDDAE